ncbi:unnamed protein product [Phytomonas sp. Hart1]|nr:unnamed protein product [Phytomonas sp. Hart1]|eukprot:CCW71424.1 unnamed protein product [Phytomonas sp. isolate Hart1]
MFLLVKLAHADNFALNVDASSLSDDVPKSAAPNMLPSALATVLGDNPTCTVPNCDACDPTDANKCTSCFPEYGVKEGEYEKCTDSKCIRCNPIDVRNCTSCYPGYCVKYGACEPCTDENCLFCSIDANKCTICSLGFTLSTQGKACVKSQGPLEFRVPFLWEFYLRWLSQCCFKPYIKLGELSLAGTELFPSIPTARCD